MYTGATTTDPLTNPINYFYITSTSNATTGNVKGGFNNCSAGPVTLRHYNMAYTLANLQTILEISQK